MDKFRSEKDAVHSLDGNSEGREIQLKAVSAMVKMPVSGHNYSGITDSETGFMQSIPGHLFYGQRQ